MESAPEMALIVAVLRQALADVREPGEIGAEARAWVAGPGLAWWVECAGLDVAAVREALVRSHLR